RQQGQRLADSADGGGPGQGHAVEEDTEWGQPLRSVVGTVPGGADGLEVGPHPCRTGPDRVPVEGARRPVPGVRAMVAKRGAALARPPQEMALLRGTGHVRQPGVVARQLSPADPCAKEKLIGQAASCEGRGGRLEPDDGELSSPVLRGREVSDGLLLPDCCILSGLTATTAGAGTPARTPGTG